MNPPWLLLRGLTRSARHWGDFAGRLATADAPAPVLAVDLAGNGARFAETSATRVEAMAEDLRGHLRVAGHPPPYRMLALSLGGMVATAWAHAHPQELTQLVLVNSSLRPFSPWYRRMRPTACPQVLRLLSSGDAWRRERGVLALTSRHYRPGSAAGDAVLADWLECQRAQPVSRANACRQLVAALRYRPPCQPPAVPTLLLASTQDALVDVRCSRAIAAAWRAPLREHPSAGHDLPLDAPDWLLQQLTAD